MKDYSINEEEKKKFICNLKIVDGKIVAYLADGTEEIHPYNKEELVSLLEIMKLQVIDADEYFNREKIKLKNSIHNLIFRFLAMAFILIIDIPYLGSSSLIVFGFTIGETLIFRAAIADIKNIINSKKNIDDVIKHRLYVKNMDMLNNSVSLDLSKVSEPTKELLSNGIDINKVDSVSRKEMEYIVGAKLRRIRGRKVF